MNGTFLKQEKPIESIDAERIVLDEKGKYPRQIVITGKGGFKKQYLLVKTQAGNYMLTR